MTITATTNLSLPLITTGTESGLWGDEVNNGLTAYLDIAIAGGLAISITTADVTLANTAGTSSATGIVSTTAQYAILNISGAKTAARNLILPSSSREYTINNAGTGGFLLTVKGSATTGVTLVDGEKAIVAWNGSDYVKISSTPSSLVAGGVTYGTGASNASTAAGTSGQALISAGAGAPAFGNLAIGTANTNVSGALTVTNGGTGAATLTANNVLLGNGTSALQVVAPGTNGNVLTSNGTTWTSSAPASSGYPGMSGQFFSSSGTFTIPTGITAIKVSLVSGGGGASGAQVCPFLNGFRGGPGGSAVQTFTGLTPGNTLTVTVGAGGTGGTYSINGGAGGTSSVASGTQTITTIQATGGGGGVVGTSAGAAGTVSGVANNTSGVLGYAVAANSIGATNQLGYFGMPLPLGGTGGQGGFPGSGSTSSGSAGIQGYVLIEY